VRPPGPVQRISELGRQREPGRAAERLPHHRVWRDVVVTSARIAEIDSSTVIFIANQRHPRMIP
jgi:hypothetical protein